MIGWDCDLIEDDTLMVTEKTVLYCYQAGHYPNPRKSGADRVFWVNTNGLRNANFDIVFIEIGSSINQRSGNEDEFIDIGPESTPNRESYWIFQYKTWIFPIINPGKNKYSSSLYYKSPHIISDILKKNKPDLLFFENIRTFILFSSFISGFKNIICIHDLDYIFNYEKSLLRIAQSKSSRIVKYLKKVKVGLQRWTERNFTMKLLRKAGLIYVISQNDFRSLQKLKSKLVHIPCPVTIVPNNEDLKKIESKLTNVHSRKIKILHVGKVDSSHNQKGIMWFLYYCWPKIKNHNIAVDYEFHFIGSRDGSYAKILEHMKEPQLSFRGFVENLQEELVNMDFAIVPPGFPTGFRTKIPEAFAWGLPIVMGHADAYSVGLNEGDPRVLIADSPDKFATACISLIENDELRLKMANEALHWKRSQFKAESIINMLTERIIEYVNN